MTSLNLNSCQKLQELMQFYRTPHLCVDPRKFEETIQDYISGVIRVRNEHVGPQHPPHRAMNDFWWGHTHDFGTFRIEGVMGERHIWILGRFLDYFGITAEQFSGKEVLDVGCWTGGVGLALHRMGARVTAIDEIAQYPHALAYMAQSFGLADFTAESKNLYRLHEEPWKERFDVVAFFGVLYHLSDMLVGLRRVWEVMKPGALLLVESRATDAPEAICLYTGAARQRREGKGWDYYVPSPRAIQALLEDVGFEVARVGNGPQDYGVTAVDDPLGPSRCLAVAKKIPGFEMYPAGLSVSLALPFTRKLVGANVIGWLRVSESEPFTHDLEL